MRNLSLVLLLAVLGVGATACNLTGVDGSWLGYGDGSNGSHGVAVLPLNMVAVTADGGQTWWHPEGQVKHYDCLSSVIHQLYANLNASQGTFGRWYDTGEFQAAPLGDLYSSVKDDSGDLWISGPTIAQLTAGAGGYTSAVSYGNACLTGNTPWADTLIVRQNTPLPDYSTGVSDNMSNFMLPVYNNDAGTEVVINSMLDRFPLATRLEILKTIDVQEDIVRVATPTGRVREDIVVRLTEMTMNGQTYVPSEPVGMLMTSERGAFSFDRSIPGYKPFVGWLADRLEETAQAGGQPDWTMTINDSFTFTSQDLRQWLPTAEIAFGGQTTVDHLRAIAGTLDREIVRRVDRRFDLDTTDAAGFGRF